MKKYTQLIQDNIDEKTDYILIPETAFINVDQLRSHFVIRSLQNEMKDRPSSTLVMGISAFKEYQEEDIRPDNLFTYCNQDKTQCRYIDSYNASIQLNAQTEPQDVTIPLYKKSKLVPGAESMPFIAIYFFKNLILDMAVIGLAFRIQEIRSVLTSVDVSVAPLICYESIYGDFVTEFVKKGANILFVLTNDGWWITQQDMYNICTYPDYEL